MPVSRAFEVKKRTFHEKNPLKGDFYVMVLVVANTVFQIKLAEKFSDIFHPDLRLPRVESWRLVWIRRK